MNKRKGITQLAPLGVLTMVLGPMTAFSQTPPYVHTTARDFLVTGDFNGDGRTDIALIDHQTGGVRFGYAKSDGNFDWPAWRWSGISHVGSVAVGRFLDKKADALAFASGEENYVTLLSWRGDGVSDRPQVIRNGNRIPGCVLVVPRGDRLAGEFDDLCVSSFGDPEPKPNRLTLFRNNGREFTQVSDAVAQPAIARGNRVWLRRGGKEYAAFFSPYSAPWTMRLAVGEMAGSDLATVLTTPQIPAGTDYLNDYIVGHFRGEDLSEFIFYKRFERTLWVCPVSETNGKLQAGELKSFTLEKPIAQLATVEGTKQSRLLAVFGENEAAQLLDFDTTNAPVMAKSLTPGTNTFLRFAVPIPNGFVLFASERALDASRWDSRVYSLAYQKYQLNADDTYTPTGRGQLPGYDRDHSSVFQIHERIVAGSTAKIEADMKGYTNTISGTIRHYEMVAIPGGQFVMGSPATEKKRAADEGPQHHVQISPFWMGQFEVTWAQYLLFNYPEDELKQRATNPPPMEVNEVSDAVSRPSKPYIDMSFGMGKIKHGRDFPAIAMTQHAANKFCQWLSAKTGHFYRLPTEAEWEYAARAGTTNSYFFGDDPTQLPKYAWFFDNANGRYESVGRKLPNPWGLYDIYGNAAEWVLDQHDESFYQACATQGMVPDPWNKAVQPYPHVVRGGSYDDDADALRSAARYKSNPEWKVRDPDVPKSKWWLTDPPAVGFRIVRPLKIPSPEEMMKYWNSGVERDVVVQK